MSVENIIANIYDNLANMIQSKLNIKQAIKNKNINVPNDILIDEYAVYIDDIETGNTDKTDSYVEKTIKIINTDVTIIRSYACYGSGILESINAPLITSIEDYAFYSCTNLTIADFPLVTSIGDYAFCSCTNLTIADFSLATSIGSFAFYSCIRLTTVDLPLVTSIGTYAFYNCTSLTIADFSLATSIGSFAFRGCARLTTLILRKTSRVTLSNINAFTNTPIANGTGYVYVPDNLVASYKAASNWITYADQIRSLSELPEEED